MARTSMRVLTAALLVMAVGTANAGAEDVQADLERLHAQEASAMQRGDWLFLLPYEDADYAEIGLDGGATGRDELRRQTETSIPRWHLTVLTYSIRILHIDRDGTDWLATVDENGDFIAALPGQPTHTARFPGNVVKVERWRQVADGLRLVKSQVIHTDFADRMQAALQPAPPQHQAAGAMTPQQAAELATQQQAAAQQAQMDQIRNQQMMVEFGRKLNSDQLQTERCRMHIGSGCGD